MDKMKGLKESQIESEQKGRQQVESRPFAEHTQWLKKMFRPHLTDQSVIVGFYYFWRPRNRIFRQYYKQFQPEYRKLMKQRAWICQQYSKRYLGGGILELWYMHIIGSMDFLIPNEPLVELQQEELRPILQRIYQTHDPNFEKPVLILDSPSLKQLKKNHRKGFFGCLAMIFNGFKKLEEKQGESQVQAQPFIPKQYQKHD